MTVLKLDATVRGLATEAQRTLALFTAADQALTDHINTARRQGSLEVIQAGDLVVWTKDLYEADPPEMKVMWTDTHSAVATVHRPGIASGHSADEEARFLTVPTLSLFKVLPS